MKPILLPHLFCARRRLPAIAVAIAIAAVSVLSGTLFAAKALIEKQDLFEAGADGYALYRIPGIVVTKQGTALAYCEARKSDKGDWGPIDVLLRRSTDGGRTWEPRQTIVQVEGELPVNPVAAAQNLDKPGDNTVNNPVAIVDHETGAIHFLYYDEGKTWPANKSLELEYGAYSDLAVLPDGTVLCLYERGRASDMEIKKSTSYAYLTVARFNLEWLTNGKDSLAGTLDGRSSFGGKRDDFRVAGAEAFVIHPANPAPGGAKPWVWYAPTIGNHPGQANEWLLTRLRERGFYVAGVYAGETFANPKSREQFAAFYEHVRKMIEERYRALGGPIELIVVPGKGHQYDPGFFESETMLEFLLAQGLGETKAANRQ